MSEGMNKVFLAGNLTADSELRFTSGGTAVLNIRMATNESYVDKDQQRKERTEYHNVVVWGKRGEALAKILAKGSSVLIEGALRTSSYDDKEGVKRYKTEIHASNVMLMGRGSRGEDDGGSGDAGHAQAPAPAQQPRQQAQQPQSNGGQRRGSGTGYGGGGQQAPQQQAPAAPDGYGDEQGPASDLPF